MCEHSIQYSDVLRLDLDNKRAVVAEITIAGLSNPGIAESAEIHLLLLERAGGSRLSVVSGQQLRLLVLRALIAGIRESRVSGVNAVEIVRNVLEVSGQHCAEDRMAVHVRVDIVIGNVLPLDTLCIQEIQHCVMIGHERDGVLRSNLTVAVLNAGAVVLGHCNADDSGSGGVLPDLAYKSLIGQLIDVVVLALVVYGEIDEYQVGILAQHLSVAAVYA